MHGGGPDVKPGKPLGDEYKREDLQLVEAGCENLKAHIETVKLSGVTPVVCINGFETDTKAEIELVKKIARRHGAKAAYSQHWLKGGEGAKELAETVITACEEDHTSFNYLYDLSTPLREKIELIATKVYGAEGVDYSPKAKEKVERFEKAPDLQDYTVCMVKTHLSLSHNPQIKGKPENWRLPIDDFLLYKGAGFIVPVAGSIKLMPGTGSNPGFRKIDVDVETGKVTGLF
jgi:formate--tetrahydrofolate ligase